MDEKKKKPTYEEIKDKKDFTEDECDVIAQKAREEMKTDTHDEE